MKIFAFILSIYIMVLTAIPCIDKSQDNILHITEQTQNTNHNHSNENDACSPFCTCQCCATPVVFQEYVVQFNCFTILQNHYSEYSPSYISSSFSHIWQPPKIS